MLTKTVENISEIHWKIFSNVFSVMETHGDDTSKLFRNNIECFQKNNTSAIRATIATTKTLKHQIINTVKLRCETAWADWTELKRTKHKHRTETCWFAIYIKNMIIRLWHWRNSQYISIGLSSSSAFIYFQWSPVCCMQQSNSYFLGIFSHHYVWINKIDIWI